MLKNDINLKVDADWVRLMKEARDSGISKEDVRHFFQKNKRINVEPLKKIRE